MSNKRKTIIDDFNFEITGKASDEFSCYRYSVRLVINGVFFGKEFYLSKNLLKSLNTNPNNIISLEISNLLYELAEDVKKRMIL